MNQKIKGSKWLTAVFLVCFVNSIPGMAGQSDAYRYVLKVSHNKKLCGHMQGVYSRNFKYPFVVSKVLSDYAEGGRYALPLLPGLPRDPELSREMALSLLPASQEFDAVKWREGRVQYSNGNDQAIMVADVDIDNDGSVDTVVKFFFVQPDLLNKPRPVDALAVYRGAIKPELLPHDINSLYSKSEGNQTPVNIGFDFGSDASVFPYTIVRVFNYGGVNYLSAYGGRWLKKSSTPKHRWPDHEYIDVLQYHGGGDNLGKQQGWSPLKIETICQFHMAVINKRNSGGKL